MRSLRHWTPRYIFNRVILLITEKQHPDWPWLTSSSIRILSSWLRNEDVGFEWGSGRSTLWFSQRVKKIISIEHSREYYNKVTNSLRQANIKNVEPHRIECDEKVDAPNSLYVKIIEKNPDSTFDFILVDGILRHHCAFAALPKVRPGGLIIIDNVNNKRLDDIWNEMSDLSFFQKIRALDSRTGACHGCQYLLDCKGCRSRTFMVTGDWFSTDPCCPLIGSQT